MSPTRSPGGTAKRHPSRQYRMVFAWQNLRDNRCPSVRDFSTRATEIKRTHLSILVEGPTHSKSQSKKQQAIPWPSVPIVFGGVGRQRRRNCTGCSHNTLLDNQSVGQRLGKTLKLHNPEEVFFLLVKARFGPRVKLKLLGPSFYGRIWSTRRHHLVLLYLHLLSDDIIAALEGLPCLGIGIVKERNALQDPVFPARTNSFDETENCFPSEVGAEAVPKFCWRSG